MHEDVMDAEDREAGMTVGGGMILLLGVLFALHVAGFRFAGGVSGGLSL
jgi:hypothetical protein